MGALSKLATSTCLLAFVACSSSSSDDGSGGAPSAGAGGTSSGGSGIMDASFGGSGGSTASGGSAGVSQTGGSSGTGGSAGQSGDAGADAPFVCDGTGTLDCSASQATSYSCGDPAPNLKGAVGNAVKSVLAANPSWFDANQGPAACCPLALEPDKFVDAVVAAINAGGECAQRDPNNPSIELVVKHNNKCSEQWVVLTSANIVRNPPKFQGSCVPAWL